MENSILIFLKKTSLLENLEGNKELSANRHY